MCYLPCYKNKCTGKSLFPSRSTHCYSCIFYINGCNSAKNHRSVTLEKHSLLRIMVLLFTKFQGVGGWSGGAMVLGKLPVPGRPTIWITVGQGPTALAVGAGGGCLDIFTLIYPFFPLSPSLWETARYRLKYCLKGPLNPKPTNQPKKFQLHYIKTVGEVNRKQTC